MPREALQPMSNMLEQALDYWDSKRAGRHMPARRDIDPTEMSHLLPHIVLIDVQHDPLDFRYRLVGTAVAGRLGRDSTGERFSALPHQAHGTAVWKTAVRIIEEKRPIVSHVALVGTNRWVSNYRDLSMPLSEDDRAVNMILGVIQFENP